MKHAWLFSDLLQVSKGEPLSSGLSTDESIISASAVPHCGAKRRRKVGLKTYTICKSFHQQALCDPSINIYATDLLSPPSTIPRIWTICGAAMLLHSLPMKIIKRVVSWRVAHFCHTRRPRSWMAALTVVFSRRTNVNVQQTDHKSTERRPPTPSPSTYFGRARGFFTRVPFKYFRDSAAFWTRCQKENTSLDYKALLIFF